MNPCDTCSKPGACCRGFVVNPNFDEAYWQMAARSKLDTLGLTYFKIDEAVRTEFTLDGCVAIRCSCDRLGDDGRA